MFESPDPCPLRADGYCARHKRFHTAQTGELPHALGTAEVDRAMRVEWDRHLARAGGPAAQNSEPCRYFVDSPIDRNECGSCQGQWRYPCDLLGECTPAGHIPGVQRCAGCAFRQPNDTEDDRPVRRVILECRLCPGDALVLGSAADALNAAHPGKFVVALDTPASSMWDHHPGIVTVPPPEREAAEGWTRVPTEYPLIDNSNQLHVHFMDAYRVELARRLGVRIPPHANAPRLYLSPEEKEWTPQVAEVLGGRPRYWVVNAGRKRDFTAKWWGAAAYQEVIDRLRGRVLFVQVGEDGHDHQPLSGVVDLRGKTDVRQLMRLVYHSDGGLGPSTFLQHMAAAFDKRYVLVSGGREPLSWLNYPRQTTFSTVGQLDCCAAGGCWKSRTVRLADGTTGDDSVCDRPVPDGLGEFVPRCLAMISPAAVAAAVFPV